MCSYAGLRGAVGLSLALIVANSPKVPREISDIILLHVAGVALLTLLINATTTGALVRALGLSRQSSIKKNILVGITYQLDKNIDHNIEDLRHRRHFNQVEWPVLRNEVRLAELRKKLKSVKKAKGDDGREDPNHHFN